MSMERPGGKAAWTGPLTLRTPRLLLREVEEADWVDARALDSDPRVVRYLSCDLLDDEGTRAYLRRSAAEVARSPRVVFDLAICRPEEGRYLGRVGLGIRRPEHGEAELWFTLRQDLVLAHEWTARGPD